LEKKRQKGFVVAKMTQKGARGIDSAACGGYLTRIVSQPTRIERESIIFMVQVHRRGLTGAARAGRNEAVAFSGVRAHRGGAEDAKEGV
jgi:hypothetical protein